ncbi:transposase [candidate division KSB1 bacterium]|nr:transposase [candidate division KSB1 bacterium]
MSYIIMKNLEYKEYYRRKLPHFQPVEAVLFITFRLVGSLPSHVIDKLEQEKNRMEKMLGKVDDPEIWKELRYEQQKRWFAKYDNYLDNAKDGAKWLGDERIARLVFESLKYRDNKVYRLDAFSIMPNHVHLVAKPLVRQDGILPYSISKILHSLKRYTATEANKILGREGQFWQHESYDHVVRDDGEMDRIVQYVLNNPVKAGLVDSWKGWEWNYFRM